MLRIHFNSGNMQGTVLKSRVVLWVALNILDLTLKVQYLNDSTTYLMGKIYFFLISLKFWDEKNKQIHQELQSLVFSVSAIFITFSSPASSFLPSSLLPPIFHLFFFLLRQLKLASNSHSSCLIPFISQGYRHEPPNLALHIFLFHSLVLKYPKRTKGTRC